MARDKKKKKNQPILHPVSETAVDGAEGAVAPRLGNGSANGTASFAELQEQSTLHLEADVKSNGVLKSWRRKTLLVTRGALHVCKNKFDGWSEKKVLIGTHSELTLVQPDKKNANRHQLLLTGSDKVKVKVALDSANDQGALAKVLRDEGATISGMESMTIFRAYLSTRDVRDRNASISRGPVPAICVDDACDGLNEPDMVSLASHASVGIISRNNSFMSRSNDEGCNIYGDLDIQSPVTASTDLTGGIATGGALALDDSFYTSLEGDKESTSSNVVTDTTREPLYKNHEVKLYKQNLRLKRESEAYDRLDHGYGKHKHLVVAAGIHRQASSASQNSTSDTPKPLSVSESVNNLTDDEELYETTIQIGQHLSRLHNTANETRSSSQTDELSSEGNPDTSVCDTPSELRRDEPADMDAAFVVAVEDTSNPAVESHREKTDKSEATIESNVNDEATDGQEPIFENWGGDLELTDSALVTEQHKSMLKSYGTAHKSNISNEETNQPESTFDSPGRGHGLDAIGSGSTDQPKESLDDREEEYESNAIDDKVDQSTTKLESHGEGNDPNSADNETDDQIYGTIDQKSYGALYTKNKNKTNMAAGVSKDGEENEPEDIEDIEIYGKIWETPELSVSSDLQEVDCNSKGDSKIIVCDDKDSENNSESTQTKSSESSDTELGTELMTAHEAEKISVSGNPDGIVNLEGSLECQEQAVDTLEDGHDINIIQEKKIPPREAIALANDPDQDGETIKPAEKLTDNNEDFSSFNISTGGGDVESNCSKSSMPSKHDDLINTFVEKVTEVYGSGSVRSIVTEPESEEQSNPTEEDGITESSNEDSGVKIFLPSSMAEFDEVVIPDVMLDDIRKDVDSECQAYHNDVVQTDDGQVENCDDDRREYQVDDNDVWAQLDANNEDRNEADLIGYQVENDDTSIQTSGSVEEYNLSELVAAVNDNSTLLNSNNNFTEMQRFEDPNVHSVKVNPLFMEEAIANDGYADAPSEPISNGDGDIILSHETLGNGTQQIESEIEEKYVSQQQEIVVQSYDESQVQVTEVNENYGHNNTEIILKKYGKETNAAPASCLADTSSPKTKKKTVRFNDDVTVQSLDDFDEDFENYSIISEDDDNVTVNDNELHDNSEEEDLKTKESSSEIENDSNERSVQPMNENTKSTENPSVRNINGSGPWRAADGSNSKLQQPSKVVLPVLSEGGGRGKPGVSSAILLEPNAGTCLVDYSRGGRFYHRRILKVKDGCLYFFPSPPDDVSRRGSFPESGDESVSATSTARPVHTVELSKSSVVPVLMADEEGLFSITLTLLEGKSVHLKTSSRDEQMKLVFLLSDEVIRVTSPEDRLGLQLYPSRVKDPANELGDTAKLPTSPKANSDSAAPSLLSSSRELPKPAENESALMISQGTTMTKSYTKAADNEPEPKVLSESRVKDATISDQKQLFWQNILQNSTTSFGPGNVPIKAVFQGSVTALSPSTPKSPEKNIFQSTIPYSDPIKAKDKSSLGKASLKHVPNRVKQSEILNTTSFTRKETNDQISSPNSEVHSDFRVDDNEMQKSDCASPTSEKVSKLRLIFERGLENNGSICSVSNFRHSFKNSRNNTNSKERTGTESLRHVPGNNQKENNALNSTSGLIKRNSFDIQACVSEEVLGAYARQPSIVIKELQADSTQLKPGSDGTLRDTFGAVLMANHQRTTLEDVTEAVNPELMAKRHIMDSKMAVADIRRTRDLLANRALEQWEMARQMDDEQQLE